MWVVSQGDSSKSDLFLAFSFCEMLVEIRVHKFLLILEAPRQKWKAFWTLTIIWLLEVTQSTGSVFLLLLKNKVAVLLSFKVYLCLDPAQQPVVKVITSNSTVPQGPPQGIDGSGLTQSQNHWHCSSRKMMQLQLSSPLWESILDLLIQFSEVGWANLAGVSLPCLHMFICPCSLQSWVFPAGHRQCITEVLVAFVICWNGEFQSSLSTCLVLKASRGLFSPEKLISSVPGSCIASLWTVPRLEAHVGAQFLPVMAAAAFLG